MAQYSEGSVEELDYINILYLQFQSIIKRLKPIVCCLRFFNENIEDRLNGFKNVLYHGLEAETKSSHPHEYCADCDVCCSCVLKMFVEMHMLTTRDVIGDNYVSASNLMNALVRKQIYINDLLKMRKEEEKNKKKVEVVFEQERDRRITPVYQQTASKWPSDLQEIFDTWDMLPENTPNRRLRRLSDNDIDQMIQEFDPEFMRTAFRKNSVVRGWSVPRPTMLPQRSIAAQMGGRTVVHRNVIPRPIFTHHQLGGLTRPSLVNQLVATPTSGRPQVMATNSLTGRSQVVGNTLTGRSQIMGNTLSGHSQFMSSVSSGRQQMSSQLVSGRPICRVLPGVIGHTIAAPTFVHPTTGGGRNIWPSPFNDTRFLQTHQMARSLNQNFAVLNYNAAMQLRGEQQYYNNQNRE